MPDLSIYMKIGARRRLEGEKKKLKGGVGIGQIGVWVAEPPLGGWERHKAVCASEVSAWLGLKGVMRLRARAVFWSLTGAGFYNEQSNGPGSQDSHSGMTAEGKTDEEEKKYKIIFRRRTESKKKRGGGDVAGRRKI